MEKFQQAQVQFFDTRFNGDLIDTDSLDRNTVLLTISPTIGTTLDPLVKTIVYVDPLVLDLDGDGLKIIPLAKKHIV